MFGAGPNTGTTNGSVSGDPVCTLRPDGETHPKEWLMAEIEHVDEGTLVHDPSGNAVLLTG